MGFIGASQKSAPDLMRLVGPLAAVALIVMIAPAHPGAAADVALGQYLAGECVGCHQLSGEQTAGIPRIVGLPEKEFVAALTAYKSGTRDNPVMRNIAGRLTEEEVTALAAFFAAQKQQ